VASFTQNRYHAGRSEAPFGVDNSVTEAIIDLCKQLAGRVKQAAKQWTRPPIAGLAAGSISDMTRSRADLIAENTLLDIGENHINNTRLGHPSIT
jgi:hypothetical protein